MGFLASESTFKINGLIDRFGMGVKKKYLEEDTINIYYELTIPNNS